MGEEKNYQRVEIIGGVDWTQLDLEPIEAFILSRIEKGMTLEDIFYISGIGREETYRVVQSLVEKKVLYVEGLIPSSELEIDKNMREKIDKLFENLDKMNYYQILQVPFDAPLKVIKEQFYKLSKEFHPDRYFKKNIGDYKLKLDAIYKKIREAYEVLSDQASKEVYRESASATIEPPRPESPPEVPPETKKEERVSHLQTRSRSSVLNAIAERVRKAKALYEEGIKFYNSGNYTSALNNFKLCVAYDPFNKNYKEMLAKADEEVKRSKIKLIIEQAEIKEEMGEIDSAITFLEEAINQGFNDPVAYHNLSRLYLKKGENLQTAKNYCLKAIELEGDNVEYYITLGEIYLKAGLIRNARREFERALSFQPENKRVKIFMEELKKIEYGKK